MTLLSLIALLFATFVPLAVITFLLSLHKRTGVLPAWRVCDHAIICQDCGQVFQSGRTPAAKTVCALCKTDSYYL